MEESMRRKWLTDKQMNYLECHNVDVSDAWYVCPDGYKSYILEDILEKIPSSIVCLDDEMCFISEMWYDEEKTFYIAYLPDEGTEEDIELNGECGAVPVDVAFNMLSWLIKNGYYK